MSLFLPSRHYVSEYTRFMREFLDARPEVVADQQKGRAIWWDKRPQELVEETKMDEGRVAQLPYVYQNE